MINRIETAKFSPCFRNTNLYFAKKFSFRFETINFELLIIRVNGSVKLRERGKKDPLHRLIRAWKERGGRSWVLIPFKNKEEMMSGS